MNTQAQDPTESQPPRQEGRRNDFGIFYPVGYIVVGFPDEADALRVRDDLMKGGYDEADCALHRAREVADAAARNLRNNDGFLASLGASDDAVRLHLRAAEQGATFLLIFAPNDLDAARAMTVVRRVPFEFAHRYHRFAIESMK